MAELHKLGQAMCSIDLAESHWVQVSSAPDQSSANSSSDRVGEGTGS